MMLLQPKFNQNGPKWPQMAQNDPKWHCSPRSWNLTCSKTEVNLSSAWVTRLECPKGVKDEVKQARRAKRVAEGHQLEIGAQRAPRFLVPHICHRHHRRCLCKFFLPGVIFFQIEREKLAFYCTIIWDPLCNVTLCMQCIILYTDSVWVQFTQHV